MLGAAMLASPATAEIPFSQVPVGTADGVQRAVPADLDRDGDLDVVAAVAGDGAITWWRQDGGSWSEQVIDGAFPGADALAVFDLDGDGDLDAVAASSSADAVAWWQNDGTGGTWTESSIDANFDGANSLTAADLDGDGDLDLVGTGFDAQAVVWWQNDGGVTWVRRTLDAAFAGARWSAAGDLDGDGDLDVVALAAVAGEVAWWENTAGNGLAWTKRLIDDAFASGSFVATGDIDGDGRLDVLGAAFGSDQAVWWRNSEAGLWTRRLIISEDGARTAEPVDLDDDGDLDVLVAGNVSDRMGWWENTDGLGEVWLERTVDPAADGAASIGTGDFDGDGDLDVLGAAAQEDSVFWWRNDRPHGVDETKISLFFSGGDTFTEIDLPGADVRSESSTHGDIDGDGDDDLLYFFAGQSLSWLENLDAAGESWQVHGVQDFSADPAFGVAPILADLDGDGDLDAAVKLFQDGQQRVEWFENPSTPGPWIRHLIQATSGISRLTAADLDGDGDLDLVGSDGAFEGIVQTWMNLAGNGSSWQRRMIGDTEGILSGYNLRIGDIDRDGDVDLTVRERSGSSIDDITWWQNDGDGFFQRHVITDFAGRALLLADFDADSHLDVGTLTTGFLTVQDFHWWRNDGDGASWTQQTPVALDLDDSLEPGARAEDINRDGSPDLVVNQNWWQNPADAVDPWPRRGICFSACERSGDFDRDGVVDFILPGTEKISIIFGTRGEFQMLDINLQEVIVREQSVIWGSDLRAIGIAADSDLRLDRLVLTLTSEDVPLTAEELETLFSRFRVVRDDGSGSYEPALDSEILALTPPFELEGENLVFSLPDTPSAEMAQQETVRFFITATAVPGAADNDVPLGVRHRQDLAGVVAADSGVAVDVLNPRTRVGSIRVPGAMLFADDFESGDVSAWFLATGD